MFGEVGLRTTLLEWWSIDIFALQTAVLAIKYIQTLQFEELLGILPAESGKGSVGTTGSLRCPWCIFAMESILLLPDQQLEQKQPDQKEQAKKAR